MVLPLLQVKKKCLQNPLQSVERDVAAMPDDPIQDLVILFGFGLGFHAEHLRKKYDASLLVFEPSLDLLKTALTYRQHQIPGLTIVNNMSALMEEIEEATYLTDRKIVFNVIPTYPSIFKEAFERFKQTLQSAVDAMQIRDNTLEMAGARWT